MERRVYATHRVLWCLPLILFALAITDLRGQSFVPAGNMTTPRVGHSATLLQDGRVLIAGGGNLSSTTPYPSAEIDDPGSYTPLSSAEIYDPVSGTFAQTGDMTRARMWHAAVLLRDGRVLLVGGGLGRGAASAELYDPATGTFTSTGSMSVYQDIYSALLLKNGNVLISGSSTIELFDAVTSTFTRLKQARGIATLLSDGQVLLASAPELSLFDPANNEIRKLPLSWSPWWPTMTSLLDGSVLLAGGWAADNEYYFYTTAQSAVYDPVTQVLRRTSYLALGRGDHTATMLKDGRVLIAGGFNVGSDAIDGILGNAELYDPATETSSPINMVMHRDYHAATLLRDGRVLITGGRASTSSWPPDPSNSTAELFVPESTQGAVPRLTLDWTRYCVGDSWVLRAEAITPVAAVQISGTQDGASWTIPDWKTSGEDGTVEATGTFEADAVGDYSIWLYAGGKKSNSIPVRVETCSVHLDLFNQKFNQPESSFYVGDSWSIRVTSSNDGDDVTLLGSSNGAPWMIESWGRTGSDGSFTTGGSFPPGSQGDHALRVVVGSHQSNLVRFRVIDY